MWEKKRMPVTTFLFFSHIVFFLTLSQSSPGFSCLQYKFFENTEGKGEIARAISLFLQCFLPVWRTFCHFHHIQNCHMHTLSVWKSLKFIIWERVKQLSFLKSQQRPTRKVFTYKIQVNPIHNILKYGYYHDFMDRYFCSS